MLGYIVSQLGPFMIKPRRPLRLRCIIGDKVEHVIVSEADGYALQDEEEKWYVVSGGSTRKADNSHSDGRLSPQNTRVRVAVVEVAIFLPPRYHLLLRFHVSPASTVVRIRTDRWQLLAEMDKFLDSWLAK